MGDHADISKHVRLYIGVFVALAIATVLTVAASRLHVSTPVHIAVALVIAGIKASLVAMIFMHLKWEQSFPIWAVLGLCAVFFLALLFIPMLSMQDANRLLVGHGVWS